VLEQHLPHHCVGRLLRSEPFAVVLRPAIDDAEIIDVPAAAVEIGIVGDLVERLVAAIFEPEVAGQLVASAKTVRHVDCARKVLDGPHRQRAGDIRIGDFDHLVQARPGDGDLVCRAFGARAGQNGQPGGSHDRDTENQT